MIGRLGVSWLGLFQFKCFPWVSWQPHQDNSQARQLTTLKHRKIPFIITKKHVFPFNLSIQDCVGLLNLENCGKFKRLMLQKICLMLHYIFSVNNLSQSTSACFKWVMQAARGLQSIPGVVKRPAETYFLLYWPQNVSISFNTKGTFWLLPCITDEFTCFT